MKRIGTIATIVFSLIVQHALAQVQPDSLIQVPDPLSGDNPTFPATPRAVPAVGETFNDIRFGTVLTRTTEVNGYRGRHEYSRFDPFNLSQSMIVLDPDELWNVYGTQSYPYNQAGNLVRAVNLEELRWDRADADLIWGTEEFSIKTVNVLTGQETVIKDFTQDPVMGPIISQENPYRITMVDEGESSYDRRYWAFFLQGDAPVDYVQRYIFTWDRVTDTVLGTYEIPPNETELDWIGMSPLGNWVLIGGDYNNGGNLIGLTMADKELTQFHRLDYTTAHADVALDTDGNEVVVMQNARTDFIDLIPVDLATQPILEVGGSYENTNRTPLIRLYYDDGSPYGMQSGIHVSCNVNGYAVVSTYIEPELPEQNWLDRSIVLVKLDPSDPDVFYLAKVYNTTGSYWEETHATITNDGSRVVWASNWGENVGSEQVFQMMLTMPPGWRDMVPVDEPPLRGSIPRAFELMQNHPNPFNPSTTIPFTIPERGATRSDAGEVEATLRVYDVRGRLIRTLLSGDVEPGRHAVCWDGKTDRGDIVSSGIYLYRLRAGDFSATRKFVVRK